MTITILAQYFQTLEQTASRLSMTEQLSALFAAADASEVGYICYLFQGRVVPLYEAVEFGIADELMIRAIAVAFGIDEKVVVKAFHETGDLGIAAQQCHPHPEQKTAFTVTDVYEKLFAIARLQGEGSQDEKIAQFASLLKDVDGVSARYLVRIPLGKLRLGFSDMTILDSLSWFIAGDKSLRADLESAYSIRPDIGFIAQQVKKQGMKGLADVRVHVGAPILASLCQRLPTADEMIKKMGRVMVEPKYDGVRVQIHFQQQDTKHPVVKTFSRNLENTTAMFPELETMGKQITAKEVILDAEAVGLDPQTGNIVSFQETTTRKRKHDIQQALLDVPLRFYVFDVLYKDGEELLSLSLEERRAILEKLISPGTLLVISPSIVTDTADAIRAYHEEQIKKGLEGVVIKKLSSPYEPGRKGYSWVKFKEEEGKTGKLSDTIDAVVMGYYRGEGKRSDFGIGAFLVGVKKGDTIVTVSKIGTGVSDELWRELFTKLNEVKVAEKPLLYADVGKMFTPDVWIDPKIVVEVAGDDLTKSSTHGAGYAVRFPRLVHIRTDKGPDQATTVEEIKTLYEQQGSLNVSE